MKRFALTLAAFALTGAMAFADDAAPVAKLSGYVNTGVIVTNNSSGVYLDNYANDYGPGSDSNKLQITGAVAKVAVDLAGSNFGYHIAPVYKGSVGAALDGAWAWVSPIDGFTVEASANGNSAPFGDLDDNGAGSYSTSGVNAWYTTNGFSVGAQLSPVNGAGVVSTAVPVWIGARYAMDKVFTLNAYGTNAGYNKLDSVHVTASLAAVSGLTLTGGYNASAMGTGTTSDFIDATAGYQITDAFYAGVVVYDNNLSSGTNFINYKPNLSYVVSPTVTVSAYLVGDTTSSPNYEPQAMVTFSPVPGVAIKASAYYDTNSSSTGYGHGNAGVAQKSTDGEFSADLDLKYSF
jgi:hypothetical protein